MGNITKGDRTRWDSAVRAASKTKKQNKVRFHDGPNASLYSWKGYQAWVKKIAKTRRSKQRS